MTVQWLWRPECLEGDAEDIEADPYELFFSACTDSLNSIDAIEMSPPPHAPQLPPHWTCYCAPARTDSV
jgi:hypothetical protein